jgi:hypothetical protein
MRPALRVLILLAAFVAIGLAARADNPPPNPHPVPKAEIDTGAFYYAYDADFYRIVFWSKTTSYAGASIVTADVLDDSEDKWRTAKRPISGDTFRKPWNDGGLGVSLTTTWECFFGRNSPTGQWIVDHGHPDLFVRVVNADWVTIEATGFAKYLPNP